MSDVAQTWDLGGKVVLVTGAASGIGAATARLAAADGAQVIVCDLPDGNGQSIADSIGGTFAPLNVTDPQQWEDVVAGLDRIDIAVLNAGVDFRDHTALFSGRDDPGTWDVDRYRRTTSVNIDGVAFGLRSLVPHMDANGGGAITATASLAGLIPWSPDPIYSMTKWAVVGMMRAAAPNLKGKGITANVVCPGGVATPLVGITDGTTPTGFATPEHIGAAHLSIATSGQTGRVIKAVAGHDHDEHSFAEVTGTM